jgi:RNA polymerase sigma-70 factor (ECF subfamily)
MSAPRPFPAPPLGDVRVLRLPPLDDAELVRLARARDARAASEIWRRHSVMVRGLLRRSLGPSHDVEDLVQDVFMRFFDSIDELRDPSAMKSFLFGITLRVTGSWLRRKRVRRWVLFTDTPPDVEAEADDPEARAALASLYAVLDKIDDEGRLAFTLRHFEGHELTEVATALGCSLATIKRKLARAEERVQALAARDPRLAHYLGGIS